VTCEEFIRSLSVVTRPSRALLEHARQCAGCQALWDADERLRASARVVIAPAMSAELQRALAAHPGSSDASRTRWRMLVVLGASVTGLLSWLYWLLLQSGARVSGVRVAAPSLFWLAFATLAVGMLVGLCLYLHRGRSGLGTPAAARWAFVAIGVLGFEVWAGMYARTSLWIGAVQEPPLRRCVLIAGAVALIVGTAMFTMTRRTVLLSSRSAGALAGCVVGLAAVLVLHVLCPSTHALHLQIGHLIPLLLAILFGALAGPRWLAV
jgi:hypothetical protein